ncbi:hypothetical protein [Microbacterium phage MO526]|uniref:Uncharacterized protein n=1 Tax=Microbacterium phage MO526 TaxID=3108092 RepID=A0ABZ0ZX50_9CAUD|nr:hypothetical protein [Microbacterium phage MO526]
MTDPVTVGADALRALNPRLSAQSARQQALAVLTATGHTELLAAIEAHRDREGVDVEIHGPRGWIDAGQVLP